MRFSAEQIKKLALFVLIPVIAAVAPLLAVPMIAGRYGAEGWASVAIALGVGNAGLIVAEIGWGVVGPQRVANPGVDRLALWEAAHASRIVSVLTIAPAAAVVAALAAPGYRGAAALLAAALVFGALSASWFFIGSGRPEMVLLADVVPRTVLVLGSAVGIGIGAPLWLYGTGVSVGVLLMLVIVASVGKLPVWPSRDAFRSVPITIRAQAFLSLGRMVSTLYTSLPATFLGLVSPSAVATFTASDRPMRMGFGLLGSVTARSQSWVGSADSDGRIVRARRAVLINGCIGLAAGCIFIGAMPLVAPLLFAGTVEIPTSLALVSGASVFVMSVSSSLGLCLVALERSSDISRSIIAAAAVGVPAVLLLGLSAGAVGAATGVLAAELVGVVSQVCLILRAHNRARPTLTVAIPA